MIETIINRGLDGRIISATKRCTVCGATDFWGDECIYITFTGEHKPPPQPRAIDIQSWKKYRKVTNEQVNFNNEYVNSKFWKRDASKPNRE